VAERIFMDDQLELELKEETPPSPKKEEEVPPPQKEDTLPEHW
jgi:hypothetical protein